MKQVKDLLKGEQLQESILLLKDIINAGNAPAEAHFLRGTLVQEFDSFAVAIEAYNTALELAYPQSKTRRNRGICYLALKNFKSAQQDFQAIVDADSISPLDYYFLARSEIGLNNPDEAYNVLFQGMALDSGALYQDIMMKFLYDNFEEVDLQRRFYADRGMKVSFEYGSNGQRNGKWQAFFADGSVAEEGHYVNDVKDGGEKAYFEGGLLKSTTTFVEGKMTGDRKTYYETGEQWSQVAYKEDVRHGAALSWHKNGRVRTVDNYVNGQRDGQFEHFYLDGKLKERTAYKAGKLHGSQFLWVPEKDHFVVSMFEEGKLITQDVAPSKDLE